MENYEHDVRNTPETVFRIGSITKQFTAFCILQLVDKGIIQLHDSVDKFIPEFPNGMYDKDSIEKTARSSAFSTFTH